MTTHLLTPTKGISDYLATVNVNGIWIKEKNFGKNYIVRAKNLDGQNLLNLSIYEFDTNNNFLKRVEAESADISSLLWKLRNSKFIDKNGKILSENMNDINIIANLMISIRPEITDIAIRNILLNKYSDDDDSYNHHDDGGGDDDDDDDTDDHHHHHRHHHHHHCYDSNSNPSPNPNHNYNPNPDQASDSRGVQPCRNSFLTLPCILSFSIASRLHVP